MSRGRERVSNLKATETRIVKVTTTAKEIMKTVTQETKIGSKSGSRKKSRKGRDKP
jgi:hypothetical protein